MDILDASEDSPYEFDDNDGWMTDLETVLLDECDFGTLRNICRGRPVPDHLRADVWRICVLKTSPDNTATESTIEEFDELFNLKDQTVVRADCQAVVDEATERPDHLALISDLESVVTHFCRVTGFAYSSSWRDILRPLATVCVDRSELYSIFASIMTRYIPERTTPEYSYQLLRLLLQYHAPDLSSFLETKKIHPSSYASSWLGTIFASSVPNTVLPRMWDIYFQLNDPFLMFFMCLVILINAKEQLLEMSTASKEDIVQSICNVPQVLEVDDVEDFCSLAQHYASNTPQSFRGQFYQLIFPSDGECIEETDLCYLNALTLSISVNEVLKARYSEDAVRFLLVDCRPPEQYNAGHLPTAFHLDSELMLRNPAEFQTTAQALLTTQRQAVAAGSATAGEHLCFLSSGREQEDQLMNMVVAHFLQRKTPYVGVVAGGYACLHDRLGVQAAKTLTGHDPKACPECCCADSSSETGGVYSNDADAASFISISNSGDTGGASANNFNVQSDEKSVGGLIARFSSAVRVKSSAMKDKMVRYVKNEEQLSRESASVSARHVSHRDKISKPYRNTNLNVFSIDDDLEESIISDDINTSASTNIGDEFDAEERQELVSLEVWLRKPGLIQSFQCRIVRRRDSNLIPGYLLLTDRHLFVLRSCLEHKNMAYIMHRRPLASIVRITSKKKLPELITFKYGMTNDEGITHVVDVDRAIIPDAGDAAKAIKLQIMNVLQTLEDGVSATGSSSSMTPEVR